MSRKTPSFGQLLRYINTGAKPETWAVLHNLQTGVDDLTEVEKEFLENASHARQRKNGVVLFHEILTFSIHDRSRVTSAILEDLTREYLGLRAPEAMAYAKAHTETDAAHVHIVISGNLCGSGKKLRLSQQEFQSAKQELERIQRERYPELCNSLVLGKGLEAKQKSTSRAEDERGRRLARAGRSEPSEKEQIMQRFRQALTLCEVEEDLPVQLQRLGCLLSVRGQSWSLQNVATGRKYRLKTLGLLTDFDCARVAWARRKERQAFFQEFARACIQREAEEMDFREELRAVFERERSMALVAHNQRRRSLAWIKWASRQRARKARRGRER